MTKGHLENVNEGPSNESDGFYYNLGSELTGQLAVEFDFWCDRSPDNYNFGFAAGGSSWNRTSTGSETIIWSALWDDEFRVRRSGTWHHVLSDIEPNIRHYRVKVAIDTDTDQVSIYFDGKRYATHPFASSSSGLQQFGFRNYGQADDDIDWYVDNVVLYKDGLESVTYFDAVGRTTQAVSKAANGNILVTENLYDLMGRPVGTTKPTEITSTALTYRPSFVANFSTSNGSVTGEVESINGDSHPYTSTRYGNTPESRATHTGVPGSAFSAYSAHPTLYTYGSNSSSTSSDFYMVTGFSANNFYMQKTTDPDGWKSVSFRDKLGHVIMTKTDVVSVVTGSGTPSPQTIILTSSNTAATLNVTTSQTVTYSGHGAGPIKVGTIGPGSSNIVNNTNYNGSGQFVALAGTTYYLTLGSSSGNAVFNYVSFGAGSSNTKLTTKYEYDDAGNLVKIYPPNYFETPSGNANDYVTTMTYDLLGRMLTKTTPDNGTTRYLYDNQGRTKFSQDANGAAGGYVFYWKYDTRGRVTEEGYWYRSWSGLTATTALPSNAIWRVRYYYGKYSLDRMDVNNDEIADVESREYYTYDRYGQVTEVKQYTYDYTSAVQTTKYQYDHTGRTISEDYGGGFIVKYHYHPTDGSLKSIGTASDADRFAAYTYDKNGALFEEKLDGLTINQKHFYDIRGALTKIEDNKFFKEDIQYTSGGYSGGYHNGSIARCTFTYKSGSWGSAPRPANHYYRFQYDKTGKLRVADHSANNNYDVGVGTGNEIAYDANGNLMKVKKGSTTKNYVYYTGNNRVRAIDGQQESDYFYDSNGNITKSEPKSLTDLDYDKYFNKTTRIQRSSGGTFYTDLQYGPGGRIYKNDRNSSNTVWLIKVVWMEFFLPWKVLGQVLYPVKSEEALRTWLV
ncbi:MAG: hypothetical protein KI790_02580 [Cyclobacteriaceae bacterium]|nr:hypothetical protein [Cyclobacteriaceae bacterium HetDA_MAG_MS6]